MNQLPASAIDDLVAAGAQPGSPLGLLQLRHLGGALARRPPGAGARATLPGEVQMFATGVAGDEESAAALQATLDNLGPYCYEAVEVDVTLYHENGEQESKLLFVGPTAQAIHEAQRRCMVEDVTALLERQFDKEQVAEVTALVNQLFDRAWKQRGTGDGEKKKPERAFEYVTRPGRKNLH